MCCNMNEFSVWIIYYIVFCILWCFRVKVNSVHLTDHVLAEFFFFSYSIYEDIYIYAFSRCFYPKQLTLHSRYTLFFVSMCVHWELYFALLTQCSTTEPHVIVTY